MEKAGTLGSDRCTITGNVFLAAGDGEHLIDIIAGGASRCTVTGNTFNSVKSGVTAVYWRGDLSLIANNSIEAGVTGTTYGIRVMGSRNMVADNLVYSADFPIAIESAYCDIHGNHVYQGTYGIWLTAGADQAYVHGNYFDGSTTGVYVTDDADDVVLMANYFYNCGTNVSDNTGGDDNLLDSDYYDR